LARTGYPFAGISHHTLSSRSLEEVPEKCAWVTRAIGDTHDSGCETDVACMR
jgi:hypothetical protein